MKILEFYELHAITGDVQKVYSAATNLEQEMNCKCEHWQQCLVCKPKAEPTPHKHAAMIKEWADDPSRVVEVQYTDSVIWEREFYPIWGELHRYRFADQVTPVKPEIVSSLSDAEIHTAWAKGVSGQREDRRAIANAAAKRAVEDYIKEQNK
jgi:hypothetical protein